MVWEVGSQLAPFQALLKTGSKELSWEIELKQILMQAQKHLPQKKGKKSFSLK